MRRYFLMIIIGLFFVSASAQLNERNQIQQLPKFEVCESDDRDRNACFQSEFIRLIKEGYLKNELAYDEKYEVQFEAFIDVDRRGNISIADFSTAESRMFIPFVKTIQQFPKLKPALNSIERPIDLRFKVLIELERNHINAKNKVDVQIDLDFTFDEESTQKYQVN